jgi:hypothetical protein
MRVASATQSRSRRGGGEVAFDQVRGRHRARVLAGRRRTPPLAQVGALQSSLAHQPLDALAGDPPTTAAQGGVHARGAVGLPGPVVHFTDLLE